MVHVGEDDEDETGGAEGVWSWRSGIFFFLFFSILFFFFYMPECGHDMSIVREIGCRYPINKHGKV